MRRFNFVLNKEQAQELRACRDHHRLPYMRTHAAAILKVAAGQTIKEVAASGLNKPVSEEYVSQWIKRYLHEGLSGLQVRSGRGRKPVFFPCPRKRSGASPRRSGWSARP